MNHVTKTPLLVKEKAGQLHCDNEHAHATMFRFFLSIKLPYTVDIDITESIT